MQYYLGIDIGTTSAKSVAFSEEGEVLAAHSCTYIMYHPQPTWSEQDPQEVFAAVISSANKVIAALPGATPASVSFSSAMHGFFAVDKNGTPLTNCIIWADNRSAEIADRLKKSEWCNYLYHSTGVPVHAMSPLCKLIWLKENEPAIFKKTHKFISIKEYVFFKFFGDYLIDTSVASATGLLNLKTLTWDEKILNFLDLASSSLSQIVSTKHTLLYNQNNLAERNYLHIPSHTPFIIGSSDGALANLGTGAVEEHKMAISIGTSGAARVIVHAVDTDIRMRTFCYHLKDDLYIVGGASNNGAVVLEWMKNILLETKETFSELFLRAEAVAPGSDDLIFIPYILGERAPIWNSNARGIFFGLHVNHTKSHLVRACMEGIIYSIYSIAKILLAKRVITEIHATGGFVQSTLWLQMLADVCNIKVLVSAAVESSALGAVIIGREATNNSSFPARGVLATYEPNLLNHEIYRKGFEKFERVYEALKNELSNESSTVPQMQLK